MTITFTPCRSDRPCKYAYEVQDCLTVNGTTLDFSDRTIVEFDIPDEWRDYVQEAKRVDGELHLRLVAHYKNRPLSNEVTKQFKVGEDVEW